jgi:hypothetical protein
MVNLYGFLVYLLHYVLSSVHARLPFAIVKWFVQSYILLLYLIHENWHSCKSQWYRLLLVQVKSLSEFRSWYRTVTATTYFVKLQLSVHVLETVWIAVRYIPSIGRRKSRFWVLTISHGRKIYSSHYIATPNMDPHVSNAQNVPPPPPYSETPTIYPSNTPSFNDYTTMQQQHIVPAYIIVSSMYLNYYTLLV